MVRKALVGCVLAVFTAAAVAGCGGSKQTGSTPAGNTPAASPEPSGTKKELSGKLVMQGSGSGVDTARKVGERFTAMYPNVVLNVPDEDAGSSEGIKGAADGTFDIGFSSRDLKEKEKALGVVATHIGSAPLVFVVHPSVTGVTNLSRDQIVPIFSGKIKNWKELGGPDAAIVPILPVKGDSDRAALEQEIAGWAEMTDAPNTILMDESDVIPEKFNVTPNAITVMKYDEIRSGNLKGVPLMLDGVMVSETTTKSGKYTLGKPVYAVTKGQPQGLAKEFLDFLLSDEGQALVAQSGLVPVRRLK